MLFCIPFVLSLVFSASASILHDVPIAGREWSNAANDTSPDTVGQPTNGVSPPSPIPGGVLICLDIHWENCNHTVLPIQTCFDLNSAWNNTISSIGPDNGTVILTYQEKECTGNQTAWVYPGHANLLGTGWNDNIVSLKAIAFT